MSNLVSWEPFREMEEALRRLRAWPAVSNGSSSAWSPAANISRLDDEYLIKADLPEVKKEDVKITVEDGVLTISGERKLEQVAKGEDRFRVESCYGTFERRFELPGDVDEKGVRAESRDGVLRVHIPRTKGATAARQISVQVR